MSYLAWPVAINGQITNQRGESLHMTLKYLGNAVFIIDVLRSLLDECDVTGPHSGDEPKWEFNIFEHGGQTFHVLELTNPSERMIEARAKLSCVRKDDFDVYRPHVTLEKFHWEYLKANQRGRIFFEFGPLALMGLTDD